MPPVGVDRVDERALTMFETWIDALPSGAGGAGGAASD
jgi:hypothetical protein